MSKQHRVKNKHIAHKRRNQKHSRLTHLDQYFHIRIRKPWVALAVLPWVAVGILSGMLIVRGHGAQSGHQIASSKGITFEVESVSYDIRGKEPYIAPPGMRFMIARVEVINSSDKVFNFAPVVQAFIKTKEGKTTYSMSPATVPSPIMAGPVQSNESVEGDISFLVPSSTDDPVLVFYPGVKDQVKPLTFKLAL